MKLQNDPSCKGPRCRKSIVDVYAVVSFGRPLGLSVLYFRIGENMLVVEREWEKR